MKVTHFFIIGFLMILLAACSNNDSGTKNTEKDAQAKDKQVEQPNADAKKDKTKTENESEKKASPSLKDAAAILQRSAEAMKGVSSYLVKGTYTDDSTINGQNEKTTTNLTLKVNMNNEQSELHMKSSTTSNTDTGGNMEMYKTEDKLYVNDPDTKQWFVMPGKTDNGNLFNVLKAKQLREYIDRYDAFDVADNGDTYVLSFSGSDEDYKEMVMGPGITAVGDTLKEHYDNMAVEGTYEIMIDKKTHLLTGYTIAYHSTTEGEIGKIDAAHEASYTISEFNEHNNITVPEKVKNAAKSF